MESQRQALQSPRPEMIGRLLNISQVADFLHVSPRTVYRMLEEGELPAGRLIRGQRRWYFEEIEDAIRFATKPPPEKSKSFVR